MSQEPHAADVSPGSSPPEERPNVELEGQRAESGDLPGRLGSTSDARGIPRHEQ